MAYLQTGENKKQIKTFTITPKVWKAFRILSRKMDKSTSAYIQDLMEKELRYQTEQGKDKKK